MGIAEIMTWATLLFKIVTPIADMIGKALAEGSDVERALAAESPATILAPIGHLETAQIKAHLAQAASLATQIRDAHANGDTDDASTAQSAYIARALATYDLALTVGP